MGATKSNDDAFVSKVKKIVLSRLGAIEDLSQSNILEEVKLTPVDYADDYNLAAGTPFALSHGFNQLSITRPGQQCKDSNNMLFVGASTRPGNGVPLVMLGAKKVASEAI